MASSSLAKEQENFLRYAILIVDHSREALQDLVELDFKNKHLTFEKFFNQNQHEIYHLCYDSRCCQCQNTPPRRKRILFPSQLELLFDKYKKLPSHRGVGHNNYCCSYAKVGITSQVLDLSLARCLLVNCCLDVFWYTCLTAQGKTLEQFLNSNKHIIYHLWKNNQKCCQCPLGFIFPSDVSIITENEWRNMFSSVLLPCVDVRKRTSTGTTSVCSVAARPGIYVKDIPPEIQRQMLKWCCSVSDRVEKLVEFRNIHFGHVTNAKLSDANFKDFSKKTEEWILHIASFCKKDQIVKDALTNLHARPIDATLCSHYQNTLLENINRNEAISENINLQHRTTRRSIPRLVDKSCKIRKIEKRIDALETSNAKIKEDIHDIYKLVKEGPKRQRLIDQTSAEIESHEKDGAYIEIQAVRHCIQLLERRNVVILSGREGSGKSRNGLEILRQLKEKNEDFVVFKFIGLCYVSNIVKINVTSIVLFDDAFDKTCEQFSNDKHILDHLYSYMTLNKVKLIFTMRNTVRHACHRLLSTHRLFHDLPDIDLNSEKFKLTKVEKEKILTKYCDINKIKIFEKTGDKTNQSVFHEAGIDDKETIQTVSDQVAVFVNIEIKNEIIKTDPFLGFPECCRLFTENRNKTTLDATIFKWPSHTLVKDIEKWRFEGKHDYMKGLKYVALICILTIGRSHDINEYILASNSKTICSLQEKNIDVKVCKEILKECCNKKSEVYESDIKYALDELVAGCYLVRTDGTYYFQHPVLEDTVLVSYSKINTKAIIPLLSFDHMMDLVRLQDYIEQENEIFVKIQKKYYYNLAIHFISLICHTNGFRLMECSTFVKNDIDFIHQLLLCFNNKRETSLLHKSLNLSNYFPLCLLRNIGELDDNKLTANHAQDQLLISMVIEGQTTTFIVDPSDSLLWAFQKKNEKIIIWLAKNTDHSLLHFDILLYEYILNTCLGSIPLLLQNFDHNQFDMTTLLLNLCLDYFNKENHIIDWIMENINISLIDYDTMFENHQLFEFFDLEKYFNLILHIRNKVNRKLFDVSKAVKMWCIYVGIEIVQRVLQDVDNKILDEEELIDILIDNNVKGSYTYMHGKHQDDNEQIVEQLLQTTRIKYRDSNKLVGVASKRGWLNVLELLFKHDIEKSFHTVKVIEDALKLLENYEHCEETIQLIMKYYVDYIDVNILMEKAIDVGSHRVVEELLVKKVDNISYHLDMILDKLMSQRQTCCFTSFTRCNEKIVEQLLLATGVRYRGLSKFVGVASKRMWFNVLELLFQYDTDKSFHTDKVIEDALKLLGNGAHCEKTIQLIMKYYVDYIDVNIMMEKAIDVGCHSVVEELLLKKVDNISYYLDMTLDKLMAQRQSYYGTCCTSFTICHEKIVEQLLLATGVKYHDLNRLVRVAYERGWPNVLELLFKHDTNKSFYIEKMIEDALQQLKNGAHCEETIPLIIKYYADYIDVNIMMKKAIDVGWHRVVKELLVKKVDNISYYLDIAIDKLMSQRKTFNFTSFVEKDQDKIVEQLLLATGVKYRDLNRLVCMAYGGGWLNVLELLFKHDFDKSFRTTKIIEDALQQLGNGAHCQETISLIIKYYVDYIDVNIVMRKAIDVGCHRVVEELLVKKVDNMSNSLDITLDKLRHQQLNSVFMRYRRDHGKILLLLLQKVNTKFINLKSVMNDVCHIGHSSAILWLLENNYSHRFEMRKIMNKACYHGDLQLIEYLYQKYNKEDFDYKTAMIKACRNWQVGTLDVCKWLWGNIDRDVFDMKLALNNASKCDNTKVVEWIFTEVDRELLDTEAAFLCACEHSGDETVELLLDTSRINLLDIQSAIIKACRNEDSSLLIAKLLYERVDQSTIDFRASDLHVATNEALANGHLQIVEWMVSVVGRECLDIYSLSTNIYLDSGKECVVKFILQHFDPMVLDIATVFTNACKFGWKDTASFIVDNDLSSLCDLALAFNKACDNGETCIVKLLLEKVDHKILNVNDAMLCIAVKGWDEIAILLLEKVEHTRLDIGNALIEACRHGEIDVVYAILQNVEHNMLDVKTALDKACEIYLHEELVLWVLDNIDQEQVDLKTVKIQAIRHKWWKVQLALTKVDIEDLIQVEQETETDYIVIP